VFAGVFVTGFSLAYMISPRFCHRFVGYLEEEAVKTYTHCLTAIDSGELKMWKRMKAPEIAIEYWKLPVSCIRSAIRLNCSPRKSECCCSFKPNPCLS